MGISTLSNSADSKISRFSQRITASPARAFSAGLLIYSGVFFLLAAFTLFPVISDIGAFIGCDGVAQYYPFLLDLRRNLLSFIESVKCGEPQLVMMNFDYCYGIDTFTSTTLNFMPFMPYYAFSVMVAEEHIPMFFTVGMILLSYLAGVAFLFLCRYFKQDMLWGGVFAAFYVFCGNYFFTGAYNPQFLYMYIAFPLMIVGMDRLITNRGWGLLALSVGWLSLSGFTFAVYTIPFVVVYAVVRVYFTHKESFAKSLGRFFLMGCGEVLLGAAMAAVSLLPHFMEFMASRRGDALMAVDILPLFVPSVEYMSQTLSGADVMSPTGICAVLLPCFLFAVTSHSVKKEIRCLSVVMLALVALPLIRYGLNGFQYELCRWGFIPALLICFCCVGYVPRMLRIGGSERRVFISVLVIYTVLLTLKAQGAAAVFVFAVAVAGLIPPLRRLTATAAQFPERFFGELRDAYKKGGKQHLLIIAAVLILAIFLGVVAVAVGGMYQFYPAFIIAAVVTVACVCCGRKHTSVKSVILAVVYVASSLLYYSGFENEAYQIADNEVLRYISQRSDISRVADITPDSSSVVMLNAPETPSDTEPTDSRYGTDLFTNIAPRYGIAAAEAFRSTINGDLIDFLRRCGQDNTSVVSTGEIDGFSGKEVLYSLFGVDTLYSSEPTDFFYGFEPVDSPVSGVRFYKNRYALPVGTTYSSYMDKQQYEGINSAALPYAMMNSVYLEGYDAPDSSVTEYARLCDISHQKTQRGETTFGIECYDNTVTINEDVTGCFVYLCFEGVVDKTYRKAQFEDIYINIDDICQLTWRIHNQNTSWEWGYKTDSYCLSLGYAQEGMNELSFVSPFEYDSLQVYAVPEEYYTTAYSDISGSRLENVRFETNSLTGDISLAENRALCINMLYSKGWSAFVDGKKVPIYKANGLFMGIPLEAGEHEIQLTYRSPYLYEGLAVTLTAIAAFILLKIFLRRRSMRK